MIIWGGVPVLFIIVIIIAMAICGFDALQSTTSFIMSLVILILPPIIKIVGYIITGLSIICFIEMALEYLRELKIVSFCVSIINMFLPCIWFFEFSVPILLLRTPAYSDVTDDIGLTLLAVGGFILNSLILFMMVLLFCNFAESESSILYLLVSVASFILVILWWQIILKYIIKGPDAVDYIFFTALPPIVRNVVRAVLDNGWQIIHAFWVGLGIDILGFILQAVKTVIHFFGHIFEYLLNS